MAPNDPEDPDDLDEEYERELVRRMIAQESRTPRWFVPRDDAGFDVLHRTFLGYPVKLAPPDRVERFHTLFTAISQRHAGASTS